MKAGRPLRFMAVLLAGWSMARGVSILGKGDAMPVLGPVEQIVAALAPSAAAAATPSLPLPVRSSRKPVPATPISRPAVRVRATPPMVAMRIATVPQHGRPVPAGAPQDQRPAPSFAPAVMPPPIAPSASRFAGSAWLIARGGSATTVATSQLGASQAGVRLTYALDANRHLALSGRVSAPLSGRGREAALGIDWQPTRLPVHLIVEQRLPLDGGRGGPTLSVVGGFGPAPVAPGLRLEGYGQAGVIARDGGEGFADGAVRASHPLPPVGRLTIDIGAGVWGGAQRGASRLDIGPSIAVTVPAGRHSFRLTADWRERIAGTSRPDSGPAVSIGTNF